MRLHPAIIAPPAAMLVRLLSWTWRYRLEGFHAVRKLMDVEKPLIAACWHGEMLPLGYLHRSQNVTVIVSQSYDGDVATAILERFGYHTVRGSSTRGGVSALRGALQSLDGKGFTAILADGPKGPRHVAKPGLFYLASRSRAFIAPIRILSNRAKVFDKSWDRFVLPLPFTRCLVRYGTPYQIDPREKITRQDLEDEQRLFEKKMESLGERS